MNKLHINKVANIAFDAMTRQEPNANIYHASGEEYSWIYPNLILVDDGNEPAAYTYSVLGDSVIFQEYNFGLSRFLNTANTAIG